MANERYLAALDISSSKITGVVGVVHPGGHVDIIAAEQASGNDSVRYGHVHNLEETSRRVDKVISELEKNPLVAPREIKGAFIGLNGTSMRSITKEVELQLPDDTEITGEILDRLKQEALTSAIDNTLEVVDAVDRSYMVGTSETRNPKGAIGSKISATYDLMVCRPILKRNLERTVSDKLHLRSDFMVTALATGLVVLPDDEKRLGCMLVDIGAETTTVTIYRKGFLVYLATIPLGGRHITRDLTHLNLLEERAEEIKVTSGNAISTQTGASINLGGIKLAEVQAMVRARAEEIAVNIVEQISYAGLTASKDLAGGIICIGGGAKLNGMTELLEKFSGLPVRLGRLPAYVRIESPKISGYDLIQAVSLLYAGAELTDRTCLEMPAAPELPPIGETDDSPEETGDEKPEPKKQKTRFFSKFGSALSGLFVPPKEDDSDLF